MRLRGDFPQLAFFRLTERNASEVVFADTLSPDAVVDIIPHPSDPVTTTSTESSQTENDTEIVQRQSTAEDTRTLYTGSLFLKTELSDTMACHALGLPQQKM